MRTLMRFAMPSFMVFKLSLAAVLPTPAVFDASIFHQNDATRRYLQPPALTFSIWHTAPLEVAKVFGRTPGCDSVDAEFINDVTEAAVYANLDPRLVASTVATESKCDSMAISASGAIGLMQVLPRAHKTEYDFSKVNLLNRRDNLSVGSKILAGYIDRNGTSNGVRHYQGLGTNCATCDNNYVSKVMGGAAVRK